MNVVAHQCRHHTLIEPAVHERHGTALANKNSIGLANIENRHRRWSESIPVDVRDNRRESQAQQPYSHGAIAGSWPPYQESRQRKRHHVYPNGIGRYAHGRTRHGCEKLLKEQRTACGNHGHHKRPGSQQGHERARRQHNRNSKQHAHHRADHGICNRGNERKSTECGNGDGKRCQLRAERDGKYTGNAHRHAQLAQSVGGIRAKAQDGEDAGARKLKAHLEQHRWTE